MRRLSLFQASFVLYVFLLTIHPGALSAQVTPTITWADPADIVAGTPLGPAQQNATASVPGTFSYGPIAGTVLNGGNGQTLFVHFQPTDSVNYTSAEKSVHINVLEGRISGKITVPTVSSVLGSVSVYNASGNLVSTAAALSDHTYSVGNMADGAYFVKVTGGSQFVDQLYDGILCISVCNVRLGMPVAVSVGSTTPNINFTLVEKGRISGTVISTGGVPVQSMRVEVYNSTGAIFDSTTTNADGTYTISGLPADTYFVKTATESLYPNQLYGGLSCPSSCDVTVGAPVSVALGATTSNINFALVQRGRISGKATNTSGAPLASATVTVFSASGSQVKTAGTDANGIYTITDLDPGTYFARMGPFTSGLIGQLYSGTACAYSCTVTTGTPIKVTAGATTPNINFALDVDGGISGKVTYTDGTPVRSSQVFVHDVSGVSVRSVLTDSNGNYTIAGLSAGTYFASAINVSFNGSPPVAVFLSVEEHYNGITCQGCDITQATPISVTSGATTSNINFTLKNGGTISGKVTLAAGFSPSLMTVHAQNSFGRVFNGTVQTNGTYSITGLAAGNYFVSTVNGSLNGHIDQVYNGIPCQGCAVTAGTPVPVSVSTTTSNINFTLVRGGSISGTVRDTTGAPLSGVNVQFYDASGRLVGGSLNTFTPSDGTFNSSGLTAGLYFARVASGGGALDQVYGGVSCEISCTVTSGTPITVTLGATTPNINFTLPKVGNISGNVTDEGGKPASNMSVQVYDAAGNFVQIVNSDNSFGTYTVFNLRAGTYFARTASNAVYVPQLYNRAACGSGCNVTSGTPITVTVGATTPNISFVMTEGSRISGTVNLPGRADMSGASVEVYNAAGILTATANTNAGGLYTVTGLPAGSYFARTRNNLGYIDQLFGGGSCVSCTVTAGLPITVAFATTIPNINFTLAPTLTLITPSRGGRGANFSVALTGANFSSGMTIDAGVGITVSDVVVLSPTSATAKFSIASTAPLGGQSVTITLSGATSNAVTFTVDPPVLSVSKTGSGSGTVISSPPGIDCGVTCTTPFSIGQEFALTATPAAGSLFAGWGGDADCSDGSVTMTAARNCIARFDLPQVNSTLLRGDYDGDGKTDIAVYRPSTGEWFLRLSSQNYVVAAGNWYFQWGIPGDVPLSGDFDGDGKTDIAVFRPSTGEWFLRLSTQNYVVAAGNWYFQWGVPGDVPITGDFDGDGKTDITVYRPSTGEWYLRLSSRGYAVAQGNWYFQWGIPGDQPIAGDFDGDGRTDIAAYRPSTGEWFIRLSTQGYAIASGNWYYQWGVSGDQPVAGDYDGDHKTDIAVFRPSTGEWYLRLSTQNYAIASGNWYFQWGIPGDLPVKGDFDGDSKADISVYRPSSGEWYLRLSTFGYTVAQGNWYFQWGVPGDLPFRR